ncbi:cysteine desulfurase family protein [Bradyrhizobium sp. 15]|uniref:cysteine desulfurase family protein n=1 Tax=Bradyrhizobium sp. 15 TaxID=2782633 RepID=UPI001FF8DFA4
MNRIALAQKETAVRDTRIATLRPIYLDHHSTTPVDPRVAAIVLDTMVNAFGNANSVDHTHGEAAMDLVERATAEVADLTGSDVSGVRFTSGSTESIRLAIGHAIAMRGGRALRIAATTVEHQAVLDAIGIGVRSGLAEVLWVDVDAEANVRPESLQAALRESVDLVCVMAANNEVGTIYPIEQIARDVHLAGGKILVDGTQAVGRVDLRVTDWDLDYLAFSSHKIYGPKGVGALAVAGNDVHTEITARVLGHDGTLNVPGIAGFGEACRLIGLEGVGDEKRVRASRDRLEARLLRDLPGIVVNGNRGNRLAHNLHISLPGLPNDAVIGRLRNKVAVSTGAACSSGAQTPSHVLKAMGLSEEMQEGAIRIGLGKYTTQDEVDCAADEIVAAAREVAESMQGVRG